LLDLPARTAVVTGASGGIGAIAAALAGAGAAIVVHYRSDAAGAAAVTDGIAARGRSP
jgi:3-oxoacyl-[acyl-carrier protein] reductase